MGLYIPGSKKLMIRQGGVDIEADLYNIVRKLHDIDPALSVVWNESKNRFQIYRNGMHIFTVQEEDGSFRELDMRVVERIKEIDTWQEGKDLNAELDRQDAIAEEKIEKERKEMIDEELAPKLAWGIKKDLLGNY